MTYAQIAVIGVLISGYDWFLPQTVRDNKFSAGIIVWFLGNALSSLLTNTGAFEIYVGRTRIWSTLEQGAMPNYHQLIEAFGSVNIDLSLAQ